MGEHVRHEIPVSASFLLCLSRRCRLTPTSVLALSDQSVYTDFFFFFAFVPWLWGSWWCPFPPAGLMVDAPEVSVWCAAVGRRRRGQKKCCMATHMTSPTQLQITLQIAALCLSVVWATQTHVNIYNYNDCVEASHNCDAAKLRAACTSLQKQLWSVT